ncbi:MAG: DUF4921 family protein [Deltaproteobacteria bacterium]|nr:DUF4921 family protein [Deltaproteobacteria bacterium]
MSDAHVARAQIRVDPFGGHRVIIAPDRANRPYAYAKSEPPVEHGDCPFCPGRESETPPEIVAVRDNAPDSRGWLARVVPNKFPALNHATDVFESEAPWEHIEPGLGAHEVLIEHPDHRWTWADATAEEALRVLKILRDRAATHALDKRWAYTQIFRNEGREAGASLAHPHTQILSLPFVPLPLVREAESFGAHQANVGHCLMCDVIERERESGDRWIAGNGRAAAFAPFAPRFAYETWIAPTVHEARFEESADEVLADVAQILIDVARRMRRVLWRFDHNWVLHTQPQNPLLPGVFHWHIEWTTRLGRAAGFERATDTYINSVPPEVAAASLRAAGE